MDEWVINTHGWKTSYLYDRHDYKAVIAIETRPHGEPILTSTVERRANRFHYETIYSSTHRVTNRGQAIGFVTAEQGHLENIISAHRVWRGSEDPTE